MTISIQEESLVADASCYIFCNVSGGRPAPEIALVIGESNSTVDIFEKKLVSIIGNLIGFHQEYCFDCCFYFDEGSSSG